MDLIIKLKVDSKGEAYNIVTELGFSYNVIEANFDGKNEKFGKENPTDLFLRDNKIKKSFREIRKEKK